MCKAQRTFVERGTVQGAQLSRSRSHFLLRNMQMKKEGEVSGEQRKGGKVHCQNTRQLETWLKGGNSDWIAKQWQAP